MSRAPGYARRIGLADRWIALGAAAAVSLAIVAAAASGHHAFVWKTAVIPVLLVAAVLSRRLGRFIDDWAVFLALVILFDFLRGLVFALVTHFELPVYMQYAIAAERWLCGGVIAPVWLQAWRAQASAAPLLDRILTTVHGSHFAFFLIFGLVVWMLRPEAFRRYAVAVVVLLYAGLLLYLVVPTVPPWMAAEGFEAVPPVAHVAGRIYNTNLPVLQDVFDVNPIAAMPSLHTALPTLCVLIAAHLFGWMALPLAAYAMLVYVAIVYLGEHYVVDVVAGLMLAGVVFATVYRAPRRLAVPTAVTVRPVLLAGLLIVIAEAAGQIAYSLARPFEVTPSFAARELVGRTPIGHLYLGRHALARGDLPSARRELEMAVATVATAEHRDTATRWLARAAYMQGDYGTVIESLAPLRDRADVDALTLLALAYLADSQTDAGEALLRRLVERFPAEPEPVYWLTRREFERRRLNADDVRIVAHRLELLPDSPDATRYSAALRALIDG